MTTSALTYTLEPNKTQPATGRRYRQEELERMTLLQLRDVCEREHILHPKLYELDRDRLIRLVLQFRGSRSPKLIDLRLEDGLQRLEDALKRTKQTPIPHAISLPSKVVAWQGLDTGFFDSFDIPWEPQLDGVNAAIVDQTGGICALIRIESFEKSDNLYLTRCGRLPCKQAAVRDYRMLAFPLSLSDTVYDIYMGAEGAGFPPEIQLFSVPLLDFVVRKPAPSELPLSIDFGTTNTAAGIFADHQYYDRIKGDVQAGQIRVESINYVRWLNAAGVAAPVLPTVIGVDRIENGEPVYNIGHEAERMVLDGYMGDGFSIWYDMKRWVSDYEQEEELTDFHGRRLRLPRKEIIRAFLEYVIASAEQRFKCKFSSLFLSYPVKQKARFVSLYKEILPDYDILADDTVDEGVAVLYNTIRGYINADKYEDGVWYKALIIDCGGGTTDLSSCDFSITNERIAYRVDVETSYENGDTDFGGNNLTYRIMQLLKIEAARILSGQGARLEEITVDMERDCYRAVDENGAAPLYTALEQAYAETEYVLPTRFKEYEFQSREDYYMVRNNYYYLFTLAEKVKKAFFADSRLLQVSLSSSPMKTDGRGVHIEAPRWKLAMNTPLGLTLQKDFPEMVLGSSIVHTVLNPDIYDVMRRFLSQFKLEEYSAISLTGQSCKIPLFRDAIKEFIPGRMIRSNTNRGQEDYRLKLSCLEGAVCYITDRHLGLTRVRIEAKDAALPWQIHTFTHAGEKVVLVHRLDRKKNRGSISRPLESSRLQIHLENARGEEKHVYTLHCRPGDFTPVTYEEIKAEYGKQIPQAEVDVIENGEVRYFVWADTRLWGFTAVPIARKDETLQLGKQQVFPFENDNWTANFFDGEK